MTPRAVFLALANLLIPIAVLVFAAGFFPYKPFMPGLATYDTLGWEDKMGWDKAPNAQFDKLVFMVVDALRSDFVFGEESGMEFVQSLIREGLAIPFTAHATSPTITMPRVKAMTTGSVPTFLDVILNFLESDTTSSLADQDTWLAQLRAKEGGKLVMYGDDTWLKLFPGFFGRADGTSSFFVSDFTEVDNNVTRHVPGEMLNDDWNAMIMHYLGLDHIGHKTGPKGLPQMIPKQVEMDLIVRQIYEAMENEDHLENTLFVLCGDHGMNEGGNHGGSSPGETSPALVFMSPKIGKITQFRDKASPIAPKGEFDYYRKIEQSDIAPTLAGLLGFPIPRNNLGVFIEEFLHFWDDGADRIHLLLQNARQVKKIVEATYPSLGFKEEVQEMDCEGNLPDGKHLACRWQKVVQVMSTVASVHPRMRVDFLYNFLRDAQDTMSTTASNYDVPKLFFGTALAFIAFTVTLFSLNTLNSISPSGIFYTFSLLLYGISMFASSYVEEEHNFWYLMTSTWFLYLMVNGSKHHWFPWFFIHPSFWVLSLFRIVRAWNQTGQKYAGAPDIVHAFATMPSHKYLDFFTAPSGSAILWFLIAATYLTVYAKLSRHIGRELAGVGLDSYFGSEVTWVTGAVLCLPLVACTLAFKLAFTVKDAPELTTAIPNVLVEVADDLPLVELAQVVFAGLGLLLGVCLIKCVLASRGRGAEGESTGDQETTIFDIITLFLMTQTKAQNIPLYLIFSIQSYALSQLNLSPTSISISTLLLTQSTFFAAGNNNAISSIDLSNAYNGISGYNITPVGLLVFLSNWAGPVYWSLFGVRLLKSQGRTRSRTVNPNPKLKPNNNRTWVQKELDHLSTSAPKTQRKEASQGAFRQHLALLTLWTSASVTAVMLACTVLRSHLFVWSVFSPKFLMGVAWAVGFHIGVQGVLGGLFWVL